LEAEEARGKYAAIVGKRALAGSSERPGSQIRTPMKSFIAFAASLLVLAGCASVTTPPATAPQPPPPAAGPSVTGAWTLTVQSPMGANESTATFKQEGSALTGKIVSDRGEADLTGTINASAIAFSISINVQGQSLKIDYTGEVTGDAMTGTVKFGDYGEGTWSGKKKS
jgi:hypothetical protein